MTDDGRGDEDELRFVIQRLSRRIRANRGTERLSESQLSVLFHLEKQGPQAPSELAVLERVTPPSMNRTLNLLEEEGFVTRAKSADDARKVLVEPTPAALDLLAETRRLRTAWFSRRLEELTDGERAQILAVLPVLRKLGHE